MASGTRAARAQEDWPARVLITNDDGIDSPGLRALARAFAETTEVWVVAPMENRSGSTNYGAILSGTVEVEERTIPGVRAWAVDGYPADAVTIALQGLMADAPPDLVVSGINSSANMADAWALSGTIGAARTAVLAGVRAVAVSGGRPEAHDVVAAWTTQLAHSAIVRDLEPLQVLTVDVPGAAGSEIGGVDVVERARGFLSVRVGPAEDLEPSMTGRQVWRTTRYDFGEIDPAGTDVGALQLGRIAVGIIRVDESDAEGLARLRGRAADLPAWPPTVH